ncbi:MAG: LysM peptidoglycan-binding domain-containing protein [Actinomycetota bacterium]|nr:LysM peptidoglycan-binding domain-containing protein [Actinomycetota bacterium]
MTITTDRVRPEVAASCGSRAIGRTGAPVRPARRPARQRPGGRPVSYDRLAPGVRRSTAPHRLAAPRARRVVLRIVVALFAVGALLGVLALRSAGTVAVPTATTVVQVRAGESLSEVAVRVAPNAPMTAVVQRIVSLNGLPSASVRTGESLVVPRG